jgi:hypothetical protein
MKLLKYIYLVILLAMNFEAFAQELDATIQLRPRYEYRNGIKSLMKPGDKPTSFVSQRSRFNLNFKQDKLKLKLTFQNVRTWGDIATTTQSDKNGIALFEAWAQYDFNANWSSRMGRQVLSYDNQRILGEIDWAQQGQSHDALLFSYHKKNNQLDLGFAFNANTENLIAPTTAYTTNYKSMQYAWYHSKINEFVVFKYGF